MKAGLFSVASVTLLQLVVARAAHHQNHQHLHDKRAPAVVYKTVTDAEYEYYDAVDVIVYKDAAGNPLSTVTHWKGEKQVSTSSAPAPPPPPPTTTSTPPPPPPPPSSSSSSAAPSPPAKPANVQEKIAEPVHHQPQAPPSSAPAAQSSAPSKSSSGGGDSTGPKGVAYNTPEQAAQIKDIAWACDWAQDAAGASLPNGVEFVPQLWGKKNNMPDSFHSSVGALGPAKHALFYNEPDMPLGVGGSEVDVGTAISDFATYMVPLKTDYGTKISTPCVANSDISYLQTFLGGVDTSKVDILCFHWYGSDIGGLQGTVGSFADLAKQHGIPELWINEWAVQPPPNDLSSFTSYLDGAVQRYAYNMNDMLDSTGY